jgi:Tol biopolymer transport system component
MSRIQFVRLSVSVAMAIVMISAEGWASEPASTRDGRIVFTSDRGGSWQIYTMNPDGSDQTQVTNLAPNDDNRSAFPVISPDGRRIAFNYNSGNGPDLYIINVDGSGLRQLTTDHGSLFPRWSPDGKRIAFATVSPLGTAVIATMAADGTGKRNILTTDLWDNFGPIYTPSGKQILFQSSMGGLVSAVWIMNTDGSHQHRLTAPALKGAANAISPDGRHVLLINNLNSPPALPNASFVMNIDGSGLRQLAPLARFHHDLAPSYSPDGKRISFATDRFSNDITKSTYGTFDIVTMNADGSKLNDIAPKSGACPNDGNCVDPLWGASPATDGTE